MFVRSIFNTNVIIRMNIMRYLSKMHKTSSSSLGVQVKSSSISESSPPSPWNKTSFALNASLLSVDWYDLWEDEGDSSNMLVFTCIEKGCGNGKKRVMSSTIIWMLLCFYPVGENNPFRVYQLCHLLGRFVFVIAVVRRALHPHV